MRQLQLTAINYTTSECVYEGKADVVYLEVTLCDPHLSARVILTIGAIQALFFSFPFLLLLKL